MKHRGQVGQHDWHWMQCMTEWMMGVLNMQTNR